MPHENSLHLQWSNFQINATEYFQNVWQYDDFCDVTLLSEDNCYFKAHRVIISSGSLFFRNILKNNQDSASPFLYLRAIDGLELKAVLDFLYRGEVRIPQAAIAKVLQAAKDLGIIGLLDDSDQTQTFVNSQEEIIKSKDDDQNSKLLKTMKRETYDDTNHESDDVSITTTGDELIDEEDIINEQKVETFQNDFDLRTSNTTEQGEEDILIKLPEQKPYTYNSNSPVWNFAKRIDRHTVLCNLCQMTLGNNVSNIRVHIFRKHRDTSESKALHILYKQRNLDRKQYKQLKKESRKEEFTRDQIKKDMFFMLNGQWWTCKVCDKAEIDEVEIEGHIKLHLDETQKAKKPSPVWKYFKELDSETVKCKLCDFTREHPKKDVTMHTSTSNMTSHVLQKHRGTKAEIDLRQAVEERRISRSLKKVNVDKSNSIKLLSKRLVIHSGLKLSCLDCEFVGEKYKQMRMHMTSHIESYTFCLQCEEVFETESLLEEHKSDHH